MHNIFIEKTRNHFYGMFGKGKAVYPYLPRHVEEVEWWAKRILTDYPKANKDIVFLAVWLHDIGQTIGNERRDHAVLSEEEAKKFLAEVGLDSEVTLKVAHCVRSHRCRDVHPSTLEARILAAADSASHMTDINYPVHLSNMPKKWVMAKLERDYRDIGLLPKLQKQMTPLYKAWRRLLIVYPFKTKLESGDVRIISSPDHKVITAPKVGTVFLQQTI